MAAAYTLYRNTYDGDLSYVESFVASLPLIDSVEDSDMGETYDWSRTGYTFLGWNTARNGSGTMYQAGASAPGGTYYAQWQEAVVTPDVTITYNNSTITTMSASGTEVLETNGKMMADDITIEYTKPNMSLQAKTGISPSTVSQTITPDGGYYGLSSVQINAMTTMTLPTSTSSSALGTQRAAITPSTSTAYLNIPIGYNSVRRYYKLNAISPTKTAQTYTPTTSNQTISAGQWLTGAQTILGDANLTAGNIKKDVSIFNVTGTYEGSGGASVATYTIQASSHPILENAGFDLSSAGLSAIDLALDGNTFWWIETTASVSISCWLDSDDDDDFTITLPSGTKMMVAETSTVGSSVNCYVMCHTSSTYGFVNLLAAEEDDFASFASYGDTVSLGGFVRSIAYKAQNGCPYMSLGSNPPLVLYIKKIITS